MKTDCINDAIRQYCQERKLNESSAALGNIQGERLVDLKQKFEKFFDKKMRKK